MGRKLCVPVTMATNSEQINTQPILELKPMGISPMPRDTINNVEEFETDVSLTDMPTTDILHFYYCCVSKLVLLRALKSMTLTKLLLQVHTFEKLSLDAPTHKPHTVTTAPNYYQMA